MNAKRKPGERASASRTDSSVLSGMRGSKDINLRRESQARFFEIYRPRLFAYFKRKGLSDHDADDLAGDLMLSLLGSLKDFQYDPRQSFRSYLATCAHNAVKRFWKRIAKRPMTGGLDLTQQIDADSLRQDLESEARRNLLILAENRVQREVSERDWAIFSELINGLSTPDDLAQRFGMTRHAVDVAKSRVKGRIKLEIARLGQEEV